MRKRRQKQHADTNKKKADIMQRRPHIRRGRKVAERTYERDREIKAIPEADGIKSPFPHSSHNHHHHPLLFTMPAITRLCLPHPIVDASMAKRRVNAASVEFYSTDYAFSAAFSSAGFDVTAAADVSAGFASSPDFSVATEEGDSTTSSGTFSPALVGPGVPSL
jgi:hypothetical protein